MNKIFAPLLRALNAGEKKYRGAITAELVIDKEKIHIYEYNCWFQEPDIQTIIPRLKTDLVEIVFAVIEGRLSDIHTEWNQGSSACMVISTEHSLSDEDAYPVITGLEQVNTMKDIVVFHENTAFRNSDVVACDQKILNVTALGFDMNDARTKAFHASEMIGLQGIGITGDPKVLESQPIVEEEKEKI